MAWLFNYGNDNADNDWLMKVNFYLMSKTQFITSLEGKNLFSKLK